MDASELDAYLTDCRQLALDEIRSIIPQHHRCRSLLYDLMLDYPLRESKALRPALCIATCRALGGALESVLHSAAIIELYHNAFLIHDDVEDGSESRRDRPTLHWTHGAPIAVNVGDAMLALTLEPLLDNMRLLGLGKALRILQIIARMARESTEGQAIELHWIRQGEWHLSDTDYIRMVYKKTSWYTFITPMLIGGIVAGADAAALRILRKFAALLGIAFQIQDDVLNLTAEGGEYGKEIAGDLWEGKHTLIVMHMMRAATAAEREEAQRILSKRRPPAPTATASTGSATALKNLLRALAERGELTPAGKHAVEAVLEGGPPVEETPTKTPANIAFLVTLIDRYGSIEYARTMAQRFAARAENILAEAQGMEASVHRDFLHGLVSFVISRNR